MYSATFALTAIIVIAATNLFLGFAAALWMGRGPKRWSDVDRTIVLQPFALDLILPHRRPKVQRIEVPNRELGARLRVELDSPTGSPPAAPGPDRPRRTDVTAAPAALPAANAMPQKFVLPSVGQCSEDENDPPDVILNRLLDAWRQGDLRDETPSLSGLFVDLDSTGIDPAIIVRLKFELKARISRQLRKDRRVLEVSPLQFAWFSSDVAPGDALMPVERIRQILGKTKFHCQGEPIPLTIRAGVVKGLHDDSATNVVQRLQAAFTRAKEEGESPTYLDKGQGPKPVPPFSLEIEETDCDLGA